MHQGPERSKRCGECVACLVNTVAGGTGQIVSAHGLVRIDFGRLRFFLRFEEWATAKVVHELPLARSRISATVTKLVNRGPIQRRRLLSDRRVVIPTLTKDWMTLRQACAGGSRHAKPSSAAASGTKTLGSLLPSPRHSREPCRPATVDDSAIQDLSRADTGSAQERLQLGSRAETSRSTICGQPLP